MIAMFFFGYANIPETGNLICQLGKFYFQWRVWLIFLQVRKAEGIETAGSLNILFSDKTGTITKGMLEVVEFFTADGKTIPFI